MRPRRVGVHGAPIPNVALPMPNARVLRRLHQHNKLLRLLLQTLPVPPGELRFFTSAFRQRGH
eukprot:1321004-Lingulodinium_polyedra.AAC.1